VLLADDERGGVGAQGGRGGPIFGTKSWTKCVHISHGTGQRLGTQLVRYQEEETKARGGRQGWWHEEEPVQTLSEKLVCQRILSGRERGQGQRERRGEMVRQRLLLMRLEL
jgi:hypothetical protein